MKYHTGREKSNMRGLGFVLSCCLAGSAVAQCLPGNTTCLPSWKPTWDMFRSTVLYTCNNTGMHDVSHAVKFGTVVYDWSNAKALWANAHPMNSEELITKQAEAVMAADAGVAGQGPRVYQKATRSNERRSRPPTQDPRQDLEATGQDLEATGPDVSAFDKVWLR